jgi:predicted transposase/invertase (TIGR01784 family)
MSTKTYDKLFYRIFSRPKLAADLVCNIVPQPILSRIDLESIAIDKKSYVDEKLRRYFKDILIRFELTETRLNFDGEHSRGSQWISDRKVLYVYVLFDHKSYFDKWVSFQLLRYVGNIYQNILDDKKIKEKAAGKLDLLPEVVPVIFYHGTERWNASLQTADLIRYTEEREYIPHFEPLFYDLNRIDEEKVIGAVQTVAALVFFKYIKRDFIKEERAVGIILEYMSRLPADSDERQLFERVVAEVKSEEETDRFLAKAREKGYTEIEEDMMTFAEAKLKEGREKGLQEGIQEGLQEGIKEGTLKDKRDVVKRQLRKKFGLSEDEAARIDCIENLEALDAALDEIIDAGEKRQVMEKLGM